MSLKFDANTPFVVGIRGVAKKSAREGDGHSHAETETKINRNAKFSSQPTYFGNISRAFRRLHANFSIFIRFFSKMKRQINIGRYGILFSKRPRPNYSVKKNSPQYFLLTKART